MNGKSLFLILFATSIGLYSCYGSKNNKEFKYLQTLEKGLYVEKYRTFGSGAFGGDIMSDYLTDSVGFRIFIGSYDNGHERYTYELNGHTVKIRKINYEEDTHSNGFKTTVKVKDSENIDLNTLKNSKRFD